MTLRDVAPLAIAASAILYAAAAQAAPKYEATLYLSRSGIETERAQFVYAQDCELIAKTMREAEPRVPAHPTSAGNARRVEVTLPAVEQVIAKVRQKR